MKRTLLVLALAAALPVFAQTDDDKLVARVNGKELTNRDLDLQWERIPEDTQAQYLNAGGKQVFLQNYVSKHLLVQEAIRSGFAAKIDAPAELDPKAEAALFDRYVREVIAPPLISEEEMKKLYEEKSSDFLTPEQARMRIIRQLKGDNPEAARERVAKAMVEIFSARATIAQSVPADRALEALGEVFSDVATRASDDKSASEGGILGWVALHTVEPKIAQAARTMRPGAISGVIETPDAYQLLLVDEYKGAGVESYEAAKGAIREFLLARNAKRVMEAVVRKTAELRAAGKVELWPENVR